jgi:hypothetical protein
MQRILELDYFFEIVGKDERIAIPHLCIYMALFQCWNKSNFNNPILIRRKEIMKLSKINSKTTYHKCIKTLASAGYIRYVPSFQPRGSLVYILVK